MRRDGPEPRTGSCSPGSATTTRGIEQVAVGDVSNAVSLHRRRQPFSIGGRRRSGVS
ncbi:hypothetical protein ACIQWN_08155 [Streptomyces vinaceus]|uniref:hypothetical protein n=1 Tax=Streptomyces vinaceus TaxID=1960 RepID=UPI00380F9B70